MADTSRNVEQHTKTAAPRPAPAGAAKPSAFAPAEGTPSAETFKRELVAAIPHLRAFARSLCHDATQADDLAQEALAKAWKARDSFEPGTSIKAWTFMILRNQFYSEKRRSWRSAPLDAEMAENTLVANDNPSAPMELLELRAALAKLPDDQREALILVGAGGMAYEEAAKVCQVAVGTIKSRVSRARKALEAILHSSSTRRSEGQDIRADQAFNDILGQADALAAGGVTARGDD
ncbi:MAG: RNA polymerase subunit sigma-70 [Alphaproteobacteria bacterium 32-64-14]|nr:MAG: RNA polymerase subunit sigma-70 [Alphaproteobacteria bacterium 32-64-14]